MPEVVKLDRNRIRDLFDLRRRGEGNAPLYEDDPYPGFHRLCAEAPVHAGTVHELLGHEMEGGFQGLPEPGRPHFSAFSYAACSEAFRDDGLFTSSPVEVRGDEGAGVNASMLYMNGPRHRRYRSLVQPSFVPAQAKWWIENWINVTVNALIDGFETDGRAELNVDFDAAIPMLTITGSFGIDVDDALDIRAALARSQSGEVSEGYATMHRILMPIIAARRERPQDDLISVLCQAEMKDDEGIHRLDDQQIFGFSYLLLAAGSGTTWKQLGITLTALLTNPEFLARISDDRSLLRPAIEESLRWTSTDPTFARYVARDADFYGLEVPAGSVMHMCLGAANRDPQRWEDPDTYDIDRPVLPSLAFGSGPHICLGMHVARAEIHTAISALLDRLPNLRLDPDADQPRIVGMYERGPTEIPVLWG
jgi:cytochrome P450